MNFFILFSPAFLMTYLYSSEAHDIRSSHMGNVPNFPNLRRSKAGRLDSTRATQRLANGSQHSEIHLYLNHCLLPKSIRELDHVSCNMLTNVSSKRPVIATAKTYVCKDKGMCAEIRGLEFLVLANYGRPHKRVHDTGFLLLIYIIMRSFDCRHT